MWADNYIKTLKEGKTLLFRPRGNSMTGKVHDNDLCEVDPITEETILEQGDVVLCKVKGKQYFHLIKAIKGKRFLIANNKGTENGWISRANIYGKLKKIHE